MTCMTEPMCCGCAQHTPFSQQRMDTSEICMHYNSHLVGQADCVLISLPSGCVGAWVRGCVGACVRGCLRACGGEVWWGELENIHDIAQPTNLEQMLLQINVGASLRAARRATQTCKGRCKHTAVLQWLCGRGATSSAEWPFLRASGGGARNFNICTFALSARLVVSPAVNQGHPILTMLSLLKALECN